MKTAEKSIIFDMDGVLVDAEPLFQNFMYTYLLENFDVDDMSVKGRLFTGVNGDVIWSELKARHGLSDEVSELKAASRLGYMDYLQALPEIPTIPGAIELVRYLHQTERDIALASSASLRRIEFFLSRLGVRECFSVVVCGDDVQHSKPAPDIFLKAAENLDVKPANCVVIEDSLNGVLAAKAAGMYCIGYAGSDHNNEDLSPADLIVHSFPKLLEDVKSGKITL